MTKPFLILQLRPEDTLADNEFESFVKFGHLKPDQVERIRIDKRDLGDIDLNKYSGVIVGGGPSNVSDPIDKKSDNQKRFEAQLHKLLEKITEQDFPYMGACYGLGILVDHLGGEVSKGKYSEPAGTVELKLTTEGEKDKLNKGVERSFKAFTGHKESADNLPASITLLASSKKCPTQMIRYKNNVYGTQFHTELDKHSMALRINAYRHLGYFPPEDADALINQTSLQTITEPEKILANFIELYR